MLTVYEIYDGDTLIFKGTQSECSKKFNTYATHQTGMAQFLSGKKLLDGKYRVVKTDERVYHAYGFDDELTPKLTRYEKTLNYLIKHLELYGNTVLNEIPDKYLNDLKKAGLNCTYRKVKDQPTEYKSKTKLKYFYIIEVTNG